jgi:purine-binding chemotaxis protein CheW
MSETALQAQMCQYLTFRLGRECFGIDVQKVREILDFTEVTQIPQAPDYMLGVINLRGKVVPVIDLRTRFGFAAEATTQDSCIVVLEVAVEDEAVVVGILGDKVDEVADLDNAQIEPPPKLGNRLRTEFIRGMGKKADDSFIILLDIDRVFSAEELSLVQEVADDPEVESV